MTTPLEKAVEKAQATITQYPGHDYDGTSWDIFVGNQMQTILDAARADALDVEALARAIELLADKNRVPLTSDDAADLAESYRVILAERQP